METLSLTRGHGVWGLGMFARLGRVKGCLTHPCAHIVYLGTSVTTYKPYTLNPKTCNRFGSPGIRNVGTQSPVKTTKPDKTSSKETQARRPREHPSIGAKHSRCSPPACYLLLLVGNGGIWYHISPKPLQGVYLVPYAPIPY